MIKKLIVLPLLVSSTLVFAEDIVDVATVVRVAPRYQVVMTPSTQCQNVREVVPKEKSLGGALLGGVAGGIIGSQVGGGKGKIATGALGAGIGAVVGDRMQNDGTPSTETRDVQQCSQVNTQQQVLDGYIATLKYSGHETEVITRNQYKPGDRVRVRVQVFLD
jgi:uncharacterized protein YcfJ